MVRLLCASFAVLAASTASPPDAQVAAPRKVAVLGSGLGAVSTAWYLTDYEGWEKDWDVSVYTLGYKMGGRGAAVRHMGYEGPRILEHGLHMFMGWYNNAFQWIQDMYKTWDPPADSPFHDWKDAFKLSCNAGIFINRTDTNFNKTRPDFVPLGMPGGLIKCGDIEEWEPSSGPAPSPWALYLPFLRRFQDLFHHKQSLFAQLLASLETMDAPPSGAAHQQLLEQLLELQAAVHDAVMPLPPGVEEDANSATLPTPSDLAAVGRRAACAGMAIALGVLRDGVLTHGFQVINDVSADVWLHNNGCAEKLGKNPILRTGGDLTFSYRDGFVDDDHFDAAAGVSLAGIMLVGHAFPLKNGTDYFSSATFLRMQAGMSETLITPAYEVLKKRGVKFHFFHKVEELLTQDGGSVDEMRMRVQATVKNGTDQYNPFFKVKGLSVTPDLENPSKCLVPECEDFFGQLEEAEEIRRENINLNSYYGGWVAEAKTISLKRGVDFDVVVNGLAAGLPYVSQDLVAKNAEFAEFVRTTASDSTQAMQVWFYNTTKELGCTPTSPGCSGAPGDSGTEATLCSGSEPFDTWADMSHLLDKEDTNVSHVGGAAKSVHYFCSPQPFATDGRNFSDKSLMEEAFEAAFNSAAEKLEQQSKVIFPNAFKKGHTIYDWMVAPPGVVGRDRLRHQYWRSNADPSEQYVLSPHGSIKYRPSPEGPGSLGNQPILGNAFSNMIVVGDIARTGIDSGCAEAAVTSGLMASHALTGGLSPRNYTSWLAQINHTDPRSLESHVPTSRISIKPVPTLV